jgi:mono/diheme cytochrome c family protein
MPGFGSLFSDREISQLIGFIYSLRPDADETLAPPDPMALPAVEPPEPATIEEGRALYLLLGCWRCHGVNGAGRGPSAATLTDENERPIHSTDLRYDPFKGGREAEAVVRTLLTGLNGTPMPAYGEALLVTREDAGDRPPDEELTPADRELLDEFVEASPTRATLEAMAEEARLALRDRYLGALAHYVLSLSRRRGAAYWLFREEPEREARLP